MFKKEINVKDFLFHCGIGRDAFKSVRPLIWQRNIKTLMITTTLSLTMGLIFLFVNLLMGSAVLVPYIFLAAGSAVMLLLRLLVRDSKNVVADTLICYGQMLLVCVYAIILSTQESNYAVPATSVIVFIALLPQSVDDRPVKMYGVIIIESALYLSISYFNKAPEAFSLDIMNVVTFAVVGMVLYAVICTRNVREIYQSVRVEKIQQNTISALAAVVEERDENTGNHIQRTGDYVARLTERMKKEDRYRAVGSDYYKNVVTAAPMHDIGKIKISDGILNKPGKLTAEEFEIMKTHSAEGAKIIGKTMSDEDEKEYADIAYNIARHHHERYDGNGYPDGLKGEDIPLEARIMALADVYDALVSKRVYKDALPEEKAVKIIKEGSGTQFDPELVPLFIDSVK